MQRDSERGFSIGEALVVLAILAGLFPLLMRIYESGRNTLMARQAANHLQTVSKAAAGFVEKHYENLSAAAAPASGPEITVAELINENFLPDGFSPLNVWRQGYAIYVRKPADETLQTIVLTTGSSFGDKAFINSTAPYAATMLDGGGFIPSGLVPGQSSDTLQGAFGGYKLALPSVGVASPGPGHIGVFASFDVGALGQDFLYRVSVPGHPELNAMQTDLDMTDHAIRNVSELQFSERELTDEICDATSEGRVFMDRYQGLYMCRDEKMEVVADTGNSALLKETTLAKDGDTITKPICAPGTNTIPQIHVAPAIASAGYESPPMTALQAWASSKSDTEWQVHLRLLTTDKKLDWVYPASDYGRILVFTACVKNNEITP